MPLIALVLVGGAGTRLWPLSTEERPKQFLRLFADRSFFQMTVARLDAAACDEIVVVANAALQGRVEADLTDIGRAGLPLILEPHRRDSAPAIAAGAAFVRERWGADAVAAVIPSDHLIAPDAAFAKNLHAAANVASSGSLVTFGIAPTVAATGYGYIEPGAPPDGGSGAFAVQTFHEKPSADIAARYVTAGFFWNSGIFVFTAEAFAREAQAHMPDIWKHARAAVDSGARAHDILRLDAEAFGAARKISIDYALFERSRHVAMLPASFQWSDVGDWSAVYDALPKDTRGNATIGPVTLRDSSGTLAISENAPLTLSGLTDMVVVRAQAGSFTAPRSRAAEIKQLIGD